MDKQEVIEFLKTKLEEIPNLKQLSHDNREYPLWFKTIEYVLEGVFGHDSNEYKDFVEAPKIYGFVEEAHIEYPKRLQRCDIAISAIVRKYEILGTETRIASVPERDPPKAFIAHGGESPALDKLKKFLEALDVQPLVVEEQASEDRSVGENVDWYSKQADCAIILATKGDIDGKTGGFIPRGNVLMEVGKLQEMFRGRIIYLLQSGTKFPTNVSEKVWGKFSPQSMDGAFTKVARELRAFGILKAVKPQNGTPSSSGDIAPVARLV